MLHIKSFIDKMSAIEGKQTTSIVLPIGEARGLRDDISKLLADLHELSKEDKKNEEVITVQVKGGGFKWVEPSRQ